MRRCRSCKKQYVAKYPLQTACSVICALNLVTFKRKKNSAYLKDVKNETKLRHKADRLYQIKYISENPNCLVCNAPTQVIHHYVNKARSNHLRYNASNGIPLCNECHCAHHKSGDARIVASIIAKKGIDWHNAIQRQREVSQRLTSDYLTEQITILEEKCSEKN